MFKALFSSAKPTSKQLTAVVSEVKPDLATRFRGLLSARSNTPRKAFGLTPTQASVRAALEGLRSHRDAGAYAELCELALRSIPKLASTWNTRRLAVTGQSIYAVATGNDAVDKAVSEFLASVEVRQTMAPLLAGIYYGLSAVELIWTEEVPGQLRTLAKTVPVSPKNLTFDETGRTPFLLPAEVGGEPLALPDFKFAVHVPEHASGHVYETGLAFQLLPIAFTSPAVVSLLLGLIERYGEPIRVGTMPNPDESRLTPDDEVQLANMLIEALQSLGADAWGLLPHGAKIELIEAGSSNATGALHQSLLRYADEIIAIVLLGASLTSGSAATGSSTQALGNVHNEVRNAYVRADKEALALTIKRDILTPFIRLNFGPDAPIPNVYLEAESSKDVQATIDNVAILVPLGLRVSQSEMREMVGLREPDEGEEVLEAGAPSPLALPAFSTKRKAPGASATAFAAASGEEDEIDAMIGALDEADIDAKLMQILSTARTQAELQNALLAFTKSASVAVPKFTEQATAACACCSAAGSAGVALGGK